MRPFRVFAFVGFALAAWVACTGDEPAPAVTPAGGEGAECNQGQCLPGLSCVSNRCVRLDGPSDANVAPDAAEAGVAIPDASRAVDPVVAIAAGQTLNCVLTKAGKVKCWGGNDSAQLGQKGGPATCSAGEGLCSWDPITIPDLEGVKLIAAGGSFACAVEQGSGSANTVKCWGQNGRGQLGHDPSKDAFCPVQGNPAMPCNPAPTKVEGFLEGDTVVAISAGDTHACAVVDDALGKGQIRCWGQDNTGQLGRGSFADAPYYSWVATDIAVGSVFRNVVASPGGASNDAGHTCGLSGASSLLCWGSNAGGALGYSTAPKGSTSLPMSTQGGLGAVGDVALGGSATCALLPSGKIHCWGSPENGLLGLSVDAGGVNARPISADASFDGIAGGRVHMCAHERETGVIWCWGGSSMGELGTGDFGDNTFCGKSACRPLPKPIANFSAKAIAVGANTLALRDDGTVWAWGTNRSGLLGHQPNSGGEQTCGEGNDPCSPIPVRITSLP